MSGAPITSNRLGLVFLGIPWSLSFPRTKRDNFKGVGQGGGTEGTANEGEGSTRVVPNFAGTLLACQRMHGRAPEGPGPGLSFGRCLRYVQGQEVSVSTSAPPSLKGRLKATIRNSLHFHSWSAFSQCSHCSKSVRNRARIQSWVVSHGCPIAPKQWQVLHNFKAG